MKWIHLGHEISLALTEYKYSQQNKRTEQKVEYMLIGTITLEIEKSEERTMEEFPWRFKFMKCYRLLNVILFISTITRVISIWKFELFSILSQCAKPSKEHIQFAAKKLNFFCFHSFMIYFCLWYQFLNDSLKSLKFLS